VELAYFDYYEEIHPFLSTIYHDITEDDIDEIHDELCNTFDFITIEEDD